MQRKFLTNLAFLLFLNLLIKPFYILGIDRSIQNSVGAEEYGIYFALFNFTFLFNIILDLGITNFNNRNIAMHSHLLQKHLSGIIGLRLLLSGIYVLLTFGIGIFLGYEGKELWFLIFLIINQILLAFVLYFRSNLAGMHMFKHDSFVSILDRTLMILFCGLLLWADLGQGAFKIEWFVYSQTAAYAITALIGLIMLGKHAPLSKIKFNPAFSLIILKQSYPFALLILLMAFYNRIDVVMIERLLPDGALQSGIYAQAFRLLEAGVMFAYLFSVLLLPMFSRMLKEKQNVEDLVKLASSLLIAPCVIVAASAWFHGEYIMGLLYNEHIELSAPIFGFLMTGFVGMSATYIFGTLLTANGSMKYLNIMAFVGMVFNVGLNFILIPKFGAVGAAITSMFTQVLTSLAQVVMCAGILKFRINHKYILAMLFYISLCIMTFHMMSDIGINELQSLILSVLTCFIFAIIFRFYNIRSIMTLLKERE